jgi:hypothetical protein
MVVRCCDFGIHWIVGFEIAAVQYCSFRVELCPIDDVAPVNMLSYPCRYSWRRNVLVYLLAFEANWPFAGGT